MDEGDAACRRVAWRAQDNRLPIDGDRARLFHHQPAEDVHQRRLPGAVRAHQGHGLAAIGLKRGFVERDNPRISLGDAVQAEISLSGHRRSPERLSRATYPIMTIPLTMRLR